MKIAVVGLWHLGSVTSACLASLGYRVNAYDPDPERISALEQGKLPVFEPGLEKLTRIGLKSKRLSFHSQAKTALAGAQIVWITFDTAVDAADHADIKDLLKKIRRLFFDIRSGTTVIISSQIHVGTTAGLAREFSRAYPSRRVDFCCCPENLVLGRAISAFLDPTRLVLGTPNAGARARLAKLLRPFSERILWTSVESAEMIKHALNAFLAASVTFINEISLLCEAAGADAAEVEKGLKSDARIGPRAYLKPGSAFSGGTLARDVQALKALGRRHQIPTPLLGGAWSSNKNHELWAMRRLRQALGGFSGKRVALLGMTYKPGTDTLRRSGAIQLALALSSAGARISAFDPMVRELPQDLARRIPLKRSCREALTGAHAAILATEWPDFLRLRPRDLKLWMAHPLVVDPNRFLGKRFERAQGMKYLSVGRA